MGKFAENVSILLIVENIIELKWVPFLGASLMWNCVFMVGNKEIRRIH